MLMSAFVLVFVIMVMRVIVLRFRLMIMIMRMIILRFIYSKHRELCEALYLYTDAVAFDAHQPKR